jgi:hypothetical protein
MLRANCKPGRAYYSDMVYTTRAALLLVFSGVLTLAAREPGDAPAIMKQMAVNSAAAADSRRQYVYHQRIRAGLLRSNGQVVCRESREYTVVPQETTTDKKLISFSGECREGKEFVPYSAPAVTKAGLKEKATVEVDDGRESIPGLVDGLANDPKSRDGIPHSLFPLGSEDLVKFKFSLKGQTTVSGRRAYDITFVPLENKDVCIDAYGAKSECNPWKGEVWVDAEDYQPARIVTTLAKGVPWGVQVFMGINVSQLGFALTYQRVAPGVWFPATYGTEFRFVVFWGYKRTVTLSMENTDFRKTDAQSTVHFDQPEP